MNRNGNRVLILFAHPALEKSRVNRRLVDSVTDLDGVTMHDLYERYPDFDIDVEHEQAMLARHDVIVFQHPFYWYSTPAIIKEWEDLVLEHGWAYGVGGDALRGKMLVSAITAGGTEGTYCEEGRNRCTIRELLAPIEQTAVLCGMRYLPPFVVHGTHQLTDSEIAGHAADYRKIIEALRDGSIDLDATRELPRLNIDLAAILDE